MPEPEDAGRALPTPEPSRVSPAAFGDADIELAATLESLDGAANYARWIYEMLEPALGPEVLEIGAGHGTFTARLAEGRHVVASDLSPRCVAMLEERFAGNPNVSVSCEDLAQLRPDRSFDAAVLINVLEHVEDDRGALRLLHDVLAPRQGRLILWVPALRGLYSDFDRKVGHHRRYRARELGRKLEDSSFTVTELRYVNAIGAAIWFVFARLLRQTPTRPGPVRLFDRLVVPAVRHLEEHVTPPFGQSVFAIATANPGGSHS